MHVPNIYVDTFSFSPQVWKLLRLPQLYEKFYLNWLVWGSLTLAPIKCYQLIGAIRYEDSFCASKKGGIYSSAYDKSFWLIVRR